MTSQTQCQSARLGNDWFLKEAKVRWLQLARIAHPIIARRKPPAIHGLTNNRVFRRSQTGMLYAHPSFSSGE
jgi:hypothetical protein